MTRAIRVVVVDDSATRRASLRQLLEAEGDIRVVGEAADPEQAVREVGAHHPAVVTMDLEMPGVGGLGAISRLMADNPLPIIVISAHARGPESIAAIDALAAGALDVFPWPSRWTAAAGEDLRRRIRTIETVTVVHHPRGARADRRPPTSGAGTVVGMAASTGGPAALAHVLSGLGRVDVPVLIVQHIHADFAESFVAWMARTAGPPVRVAVHGVEAEHGVVHVAPAGRHLRLDPSGTLQLTAHPAGLHVPSADVLFASLAEAAGTGGVGVVLTGMGDDGAKGLAAMKKAGAVTIAQDERSSAVWGMPRAAIRAGAAGLVIPLDEIAATILRRVRTRPDRRGGHR